MCISHLRNQRLCAGVWNAASPVLHDVTPGLTSGLLMGCLLHLPSDSAPGDRGLKGMLPLCPACEGGLITPQDKFQPRLREMDSLAWRCPPRQVLNL